MFRGDGITISPATKSRCISDAVAVILTIRENVNLNIIYPKAKDLSQQLAVKYKIESGGTMEDIEKICLENEIKLYTLNDVVTENGIMAIKCHCYIVLKNNEYNQAVAEKINAQYHKQKDQVMKFNPKSLTDENKKKREILYITYDFEFTHN